MVKVKQLIIKQSKAVHVTNVATHRSQMSKIIALFILSQFSNFLSNLITSFIFFDITLHNINFFHQFVFHAKYFCRIAWLRRGIKWTLKPHFLRRYNPVQVQRIVALAKLLILPIDISAP